MSTEKLGPEEVIKQLNLPAHTFENQNAVTLAYSTLYDKRSGTVEVEIKESKQGIGIGKRSKKRFAAQQIVMLLGSLAQNLIVWPQRWLAQESAVFTQYGIRRMVRDLFQINGLMEFDSDGRLRRLTLNEAAMKVKEMTKALAVIVKEVEIVIGAT
jgi:hypothetical protein